MAKQKLEAVSINTDEAIEIELSDSKIKKKYGTDAAYVLVIGEVTITFSKSDALLASIPEKQRKNYYWIQDQLYLATFHSRFDE